MKFALRYIPTEVWMDVICYPWIKRYKLGKIVHKFLNRYFAEILQYCLHERGKRTLSSLHLGKVPVIPQTPMPENIKFFERIFIGHFDSSALAFLRNINTLFTDVNLDLFGFEGYNDLTNLRTILYHVSPLLHGIHSMDLTQRVIPLVQQYFAPKLAQTKMLSIHFEQLDQTTIQPSINFCLNWLVSEERDPAEPRLLKALICGAEIFQQFSMALRQQFLSAKRPCTFAIKVLYFGTNDQVAKFHFENNLGEQLDGQFDEAGFFHIYRHKQVDYTREQLQKWVNESVEKSNKSGGIQIYGYATIGQIEANAGANVDGEADQQSTSGQ